MAGEQIDHLFQTGNEAAHQVKSEKLKPPGGGEDNPPLQKTARPGSEDDPAGGSALFRVALPPPLLLSRCGNIFKLIFTATFSGELLS